MIRNISEFDSTLYGSRITLDLETTGLDYYSDSFRWAGIGICNEDRSNAIYWTIQDLLEDHQLAWNEIKPLMAEFLRTRDRIDVWNLCYEGPCFHYMFGLPPGNLFDVQVLARMQGYPIYTTEAPPENYEGDADEIKRKFRFSLKKVAAYEFDDIKPWADRTDQWWKHLKAIAKSIAPLKRGNREGRSIVEGGTLAALGLFEKTQGSGMLHDAGKAVNAIRRMTDDPEVMVALQACLMDPFRPADRSHNFTEIPASLSGPYCLNDISATARLRERYESRNPRRSTVDLFNREMILGSRLICRGLAWDLDGAERLKIRYEKLSMLTLDQLLSIPHVAAEYPVRPTDARDAGINRNSTSAGHMEKMGRMFLCDEVRAAVCVHAWEKYRHWLFEDSSATLAALDGASPERSLEMLRAKASYLTGCVSEKWQDADKARIPDYLADTLAIVFGAIPNSKAETLNIIYRALREVGGMSLETAAALLPQTRAMMLWRVLKKTDKAVSTFIEGKCGKESFYGDRLASQFRPISTDSGRWTSRNIHTVPSGTELMSLRVSRFPGGVRVGFDLAQHELRMLAFLSGDKALLRVFAEGGDFHSRNARRIFKLPDGVKESKAQRRLAKGASFTIIFGGGPYRFAREYMNGRTEEAEKLFDDWFAAYPDAFRYIQKKHREALNTGKIETHTGNRLDVGMPELNDADRKYFLRHGAKSDYTVKRALNRAQNLEIQGTASHLAADVLWAVDEWLLREFEGKAVLDVFVHDSGEIDCHPDVALQVLGGVSDVVLSRCREEWGFEAGVDVEIGVNGFEMLSGSVSDNVFHFKGRRSAAEKLTDFRIQFQDDDPELPEREELFQTKAAIRLEYGEEVPMVKGEIALA